MQKSRRQFITESTALAAAAMALPAAAKAPPAPKGKAEHCIFMWLGGGMCQIDTFDPKRKGDGKKVAGSYYDAIGSAVKGVKVCKHLPRSAKILDRMTIMRTVHHNVIDEHAAAVNQVHTGRPVSGTVVYPSIGSVVAHQRGPAGEGVPAYVLMGYPNLTRGPGFLGTKYSYLYLTDTKAGPAGLIRPKDIDSARQARREALLKKVREVQLKGESESSQLADYDAAIEESLRLAGPKFMSVFNLDQEKPELREQYGGEFGQRCLLSRRLIENGVRFIEVAHNLNFINGTGWDTHRGGQLKQHLLIEELDTALSALVLDLENRRLLDKTLIVVATEFGRPPGFDGGGGRGHHSKAFSMVLAGGGLSHKGAWGETDELGRLPVSNPVSLADFHATIHACLGIDPARYLYAGERPVPITDKGRAVAALFG